MRRIASACAFTCSSMRPSEVRRYGTMARAMSPRSWSKAAVRRRSMNTYVPPAATAPTTSSGGRREARSRSLRLAIAPRLDEVAQAPDGADANPRWLELGAQSRHVHFDRVGRDLLVPPGHCVGDLVLADDRVDVREEVLEDRLLALRQLEGLARDRRALAVEIDRQRPMLDHPRAHRPPAPRERRDARDQFLGGKGLGEVVVGAEREAGDAVADRVARREHQHRLLAAASALRCPLQCPSARRRSGFFTTGGLQNRSRTRLDERAALARSALRAHLRDLRADRAIPSYELTQDPARARGLLRVLLARAHLRDPRSRDRELPAGARSGGGDGDELAVLVEHRAAAGTRRNRHR